MYPSQNVPNMFKSRCIGILSQGIVFATRYLYFDLSFQNQFSILSVRYPSPKGEVCGKPFSSPKHCVKSPPDIDASGDSVANLLLTLR